MLIAKFQYNWLPLQSYDFFMQRAILKLHQTTEGSCGTEKIPRFGLWKFLSDYDLKTYSGESYNFECSLMVT